MFCANRECPDFIENGFHAEFVDHVTTCPRCGEYLVPTIAAGSAPDAEGAACTPQVAVGSCKDPLEPVFETEDPAEIGEVEALLQQHGIPNVTRVKSPAEDGRESGFLRLETIQDTVVFLVPKSFADRTWQLLESFEEAP